MTVIRRVVALACVTLVLGSAALTYMRKYEAETAEARLKALEAQIAAQRDALGILEAEWSVLTQPARLEALASAHREKLGLDVMDPSQVGRVDDVAMPPSDLPPSLAGINDAGIADLIDALESDAGPVTTDAVMPVPTQQSQQAEAIR